ESGAANAVTFGDASATFGMTDAIPAQDADVKIDGVPITRSSNTISDVVTGVTFSLVSQTPTGGAATAVTVATDVGGMQKKVQGIIDAFNAVQKVVASQQAFAGT